MENLKVAEFMAVTIKSRMGSETSDCQGRDEKREEIKNLHCTDVKTSVKERKKERDSESEIVSRFGVEEHEKEVAACGPKCSTC